MRVFTVFRHAIRDRDTMGEGECLKVCTESTNHDTPNVAITHNSSASVWDTKKSKMADLQVKL